MSRSSFCSCLTSSVGVCCFSPNSDAEIIFVRLLVLRARQSVEFAEHFVLLFEEPVFLLVELPVQVDGVFVIRLPRAGDDLDLVEQISARFEIAHTVEVLVGSRHIYARADLVQQRGSVLVGRDRAHDLFGKREAFILHFYARFSVAYIPVQPLFVRFEQLDARGGGVRVQLAALPILSRFLYESGYFRKFGAVITRLCAHLFHIAFRVFEFGAQTVEFVVGGAAFGYRMRMIAGDNGQPVLFGVGTVYHYPAPSLRRVFARTI